MKGLPSMTFLTDGIARQLADKQRKEISELVEALLVKAFMCQRQIQPQELAGKNKKKFDPRLPRNFAEARQYKGWCDVIDQEYNALVQRGTWDYVKPKPA